MVVEEIMNREPAKIAPEATLSEALQAMADHKTRHLVVIGEGNHVAGILSDRDLAIAYDPKGMTAERWEKVRVDELMSADPSSIGSQAPLAEAAKLLIRLFVSALPVVDNGILRGILSEKEFVRYFAARAD